MATCLIGLGSNLGEREQNLSRAMDLLRANSEIRVERVSRFHSSKPAGGPAGQGQFLNAAAVLETALQPPALLAALQDVEKQLGRVRSQHWGERVIDLDLLLYDRMELKTPSLELPHPRMGFRRFVLEPAAEIAPEMVYPINGWTIGELLANLNRPEKYIATEFLPGDVLSDLKLIPGIRILKSPDFPAIATEGITRNVSLLRKEALDGYCAFVDERARLIDKVHSPESRGWTISDFWFDDVELWIDGCSNSGLLDMAYFTDHLQAIRSRIVAPKLVLTPRALPGLEPIIVAIDRLRRRPEASPVLMLPHDDPNQCRDEVLAAMQAME